MTSTETEPDVSREDLSTPSSSIIDESPDPLGKCDFGRCKNSDRVTQDCRTLSRQQIWAPLHPPCRRNGVRRARSPKNNKPAQSAKPTGLSPKTWATRTTARWERATACSAPKWTCGGSKWNRIFKEKGTRASMKSGRGKVCQWTLCQFSNQETVSTKKMVLTRVYFSAVIFCLSKKIPQYLRILIVTSCWAQSY